MLLDGENGAVLQRDKRTYAIAPHLPCGVASAELLRRIAAVADKFGATLKCTSAQRIAIIGLKEEDIDAAWEMLGGKPAFMIGDRVRSIRVCPGTQFCKRARQDSIAVGMELDRRYAGRELPGKLKMGVSGCPNQCSETCIKDIGLIGGAKGWTIVVGGQGGMSPRLSKELTTDELTTERALDVVDNLINYFQQHGEPSERISSLVDRVGMKALRVAVGV